MAGETGLEPATFGFGEEFKKMRISQILHSSSQIREFGKRTTPNFINITYFTEIFLPDSYFFLPPKIRNFKPKAKILILPKSFFAYTNVLPQFNSMLDYYHLD